MLIDELAKEVTELAHEREVQLVDYGVGVAYAYAIVRREAREFMGVAFVPLEDLTEFTVVEADIDRVRELVSSHNILEKAVGVAIINAISQALVDERELRRGDIVESLHVSRDDVVVVVGNMRPIVAALSSSCRVIVVERNPRLRHDALPDSLLARLLSEATVCIVTGSALVNDTIDFVLEKARHCRVLALVGPTAQILPDTLLSRGFTHVASLRIENVTLARHIVMRGGGARELARAGWKYVVSSG